MKTMNKSTVSFFSFDRRTFLMFGAVVCLAASGFIAEPANAQGGRVIRATNVSIPGGVTRQVTVPIQLDSQGDEASTSFSLQFNSLVLANPVVTLGIGVPAGSNLGINANNLAQGQLGVLVDSTNTYAAGPRNIANITFTVPANASVGNYGIAFRSVPTPQSVSSSAGALLPTTYEQGNVMIGATAAAVHVTGRVVTPDGRGIRNSIVILTDGEGNRRVATTSSFGFYRFDEVEAGKTYVIGVQSKRYLFTTRVVQILDTLADFDFVGQQ